LAHPSQNASSGNKKALELQKACVLGTHCTAENTAKNLNKCRDFKADLQNTIGAPHCPQKHPQFCKDSAFGARGALETRKIYLQEVGQPP